MKSDTIAIIVVCSSVGLVLVLVAFRYLIRQSNRKNSAPLPPVQPLAHHREIHVAQFQERLSLSPYSLGSSSLRTSRVSLVSKDRSTPTRVPSYILQSETAEDISLNGLPLSPASPLPLPNPSFHLNSAQSDSSLSLGSSTSDEIQQAETPPTSSSFSTQSHATSYSGHESRRSLNQPHSANRSRSRPGSYISVASTSRTSRSIRRGLPHDPQSQLQIVLPAPLAAAASPYATLGTGTPSASRLSVHGMPERRLSFVDGWAPKAMRSEGLYERNRSSSESLPAPPKRNVLKRPHSSLRMSTTPSHESPESQSRPSSAPHRDLSPGTFVPGVPVPPLPMPFNVDRGSVSGRIIHEESGIQAPQAPNIRPS